MNDNTQVVIVDQSEQMPFGLVSLLIICGFVALAIEYFWQLIAIAFIVYVAVHVYRRFKAEDARQRQLLADAELQNRQFIAGDPRGIYGDFDHEGPK